MREKRIDLYANRPKLITNQMVQEADMIIVMGCSAEGIRTQTGSSPLSRGTPSRLGQPRKYPLTHFFVPSDVLACSIEFVEWVSARYA